MLSGRGDRMPLCNRVTPTGEIIATAARGELMGNRGCLHTAARELGTRRWTTRAWVSCALSVRDRRRRVMTPGRYTELFFLDEAVALAAGHRPCGACRRDAHRSFRTAWARATGADDTPIQHLDRKLHSCRIDPHDRRQIRHRRPLQDLPDGVFIALPDRTGADQAWLVEGRRLIRYHPEGYRDSVARPHAGLAEVLTPSLTVDVLVAGYRPAIHRSAGLSARSPLVTRW